MVKFNITDTHGQLLVGKIVECQHGGQKCWFWSFNKSKNGQPQACGCMAAAMGSLLIINACANFFIDKHYLLLENVYTKYGHRTR